MIKIVNTFSEKSISIDYSDRKWQWIWSFETKTFSVSQGVPAVIFAMQCNLEHHDNFYQILIFCTFFIFPGSRFATREPLLKQSLRDYSREFQLKFEENWLKNIEMANLSLFLLGKKLIFENEFSWLKIINKEPGHIFCIKKK